MKLFRSRNSRHLPSRSVLRTLAFAIPFVAATLATASGRFDRHDSSDCLVDLTDNHWRFSIGDDPRRAETGFDDSTWSRIEVPGAWEDDGYAGYNGFAWYRCTFAFSDETDQPTNLLLGRIDDVDEVFLNGKRIGGCGSFPPNYVSAYNQNRVYPVPAGTLRAGKDNVIAVRVYDGGGYGGIMDYPVGLYAAHVPRSEIDLGGVWLFHPGDNPAWSAVQTDESGFTPITVPSYWEDAGFPDLDGFAWYRKAFHFAQPIENQTMVLMLGKIDDTDEVFLNGTRIGQTGNLDDSDRHSGVGYYAESRGYYFPASLLKADNVIAVRVHDHGGRGGIYEGPIGIIGQSEYIRYWETVRHDRPRNSTIRIEALRHWLGID